MKTHTHTPHISYSSQGHSAVAVYEAICLFNTSVLQRKSTESKQFNPLWLLREHDIFTQFV